MNLRLASALVAGLLLAAPSLSLADAGKAEAAAARSAVPACPASTLERKLNLAQTIQSECCKEHKGVCGCRAGKIVCCDGKPSTVTGCTCHGDDGFLE